MKTDEPVGPKMIADTVTVSRIVFSLILLFLSPYSAAFAVLYLLCGISDVADGFLARKLHTESEKGAMLDSIADLFFAFAYIVKLLPVLSVPLWIWGWTAGIAAVKITGILRKSKNTHRFRIEHSPANRLTGILIFLLPLTVGFVDVTIGAAVICIAATVAAIEEVVSLKK